MGIEERINSIYEAHKQSGLFEGSFENTIYKITNAYDYFFLEPIRKARMGKQLSKDDFDDIDKLRHAYRACIKFVYEDCKHGDFIPYISSLELNDYQNELRETIQFNYIRNLIDKYKLERCDVKETNDKLVFSHVESDRSIIFDIYSRVVADNLPGGKNDKDNLNVFDFNMRIFEIAKSKPSFQSKKLFKPNKNEILDLTNDLLHYYLGELDPEIGTIKAKDYYLGDYLLVYCYLVVIGMYKTAYLASLAHNNDEVYQPSILYPKDRLITDVSETFEMSESIVEKAINDMTYSYEFHKNKTTIYQPLFEVGNYLLCSSNLLFHSYVIDKIMKYFDNKGTNKADLTNYHKYLSNKMNHRMANRIEEMCNNLVVFENCELTIDDSPKSEIDLVVFDKLSKVSALIELKCYTSVDNELDVIKKEEKINSAIESRLVKDKLVVDNIELFLKQNNIPSEYKNYKYNSILVTNKAVGSVGVQEKIKVVDETLFYGLLFYVYQGKLDEMLAGIEDGSFYKILESTITLHNEKYEYKGIKVEFVIK